MTITERRICWPEPDATCLEGGCVHCNDYPFRKVATIERWARAEGKGRPTHNRGDGARRNTAEAFASGESRRFGNAEVKTVEP